MLHVRSLYTHLTLLLMSHVTFSQTAEQVVQQQLEAYNARDIDAFMKVFHPEIELWTLGATSPSVSGWEAVGKVYKDLFDQSPDLHSIVINRSIIGNKVIDYERIFGRKGSLEDVFLVMVYEVEEGLIRRAWAIRE